MANVRDNSNIDWGIYMSNKQVTAKDRAYERKLNKERHRCNLLEYDLFSLRKENEDLHKQIMRLCEVIVQKDELLTEYKRLTDLSEEDLVRYKDIMSHREKLFAIIGGVNKSFNLT